MLLLLQVYFILELAELSKLNKQQGGDMYKREHKAALELANAVGRRLQGNNPNSLNKGCLVRLKQLADKGYLAVKRPKHDRKNVKPAPYPGWQGWPRYGPRSASPLPPPLPQPPQPEKQQSVATTAAAAVPAKEPKFSPTAAALPDQQLSPNRPQSLIAADTDGVPTTAVVSAPFTYPCGPQPNFAPRSAAMSCQTTEADQPPVANHLLPVTAMPSLTPHTAVAPAAATTTLSSPSLLSAATVPPSSGHVHQPQQQHHQQQPLLSNTTAVLVAAVGPLFESFVAQTAAVVADPSMSLESLAGTITQELAAAIATAAVQAVGKRRQQSMPAPNTSHVNVSQPQLAAEAPLSTALTTKPAVTSSRAAAVAGPSGHMVSSSGAVTPAVNATPVSRLGVSTTAPDKGDTRQGWVDPSSVKGGGTSAPAVLGNSPDKDKGQGTAKDLPAGAEVISATNAEAQAKRIASAVEAEHSSKTKRQKIAASSQPLGVESEKHAVPSTETSRYDTSASGKTQTGGRSKPVNDAREDKGRKGSRKPSPGARSSQGSGRSSPKGSASWHAARQGHSQWVASPQPIGRLNSGSPYQQGPLGIAPAVMPSRLSGSLGPGSPMMSGSPMNGAVQFPSDAFGESVGNSGFGMMNAYPGMLSSPHDQANGFVPLMPSSPADWHMQPPALNNFPMAAHFLPGIDEAPDFSPVD